MLVTYGMVIFEQLNTKNENAKSNNKLHLKSFIDPRPKLNTVTLTKRNINLLSEKYLILTLIETSDISHDEFFF